MLGAIVLAAVWSALGGGSGALFRGDFVESAGSSRQQTAGQSPNDGYLGSTEAALDPMEALVASLMPDKPAPAPDESPPPAAVAVVEPQTYDEPPAEPPPEPQPAPEPIVAASAVQTDGLPALGTADQGQTQPAVESQPEAVSAAAPADAPALHVTAIGDSVMLAAAGDLAAAILNIEVDAEVGRVVSSAIDILRARRDSGGLGEVVVMHIGNNSPFTTSQFDQMMELMAGVTRVVFVNLKVPRGWEGPNNAVLATGVARYPNAVLVDWYSVGLDHPEFLHDGVHLRAEGALAYAQTIAASVGAR